jgi:hypothetical protein
MSSPSTEPLKLAYLLTNRQGQAYMETSLDTVRLPAQSDVSDFRDAVKAKNADILTGISPSQLKVYKNMAAFNEGKEPLGPLSLLDSSFGKDKENALIVVVPPPSGKRRICCFGSAQSYAECSLSHGC